MIFYYSGCGNSRWVAREIATKLHEALQFIPYLQHLGVDHYNIKEGESIGFVFPVYSWAAPKLVEDFVKSVKWNGKAKYVWFACTCGDEMGMTRKLFAKTLRKAGMKLDACYCFVMPETYLAFPGFHLDTDDGARKKIKEACEKLPIVIENIENCKQGWDEVIGGWPRVKSYLIRPGFVKMVGDGKYHVTDECIGCGKCSKTCPLMNIEMLDKRPKWKGHCTQCMACYHVCPKNAIQYSSYTKGKGQYRFSEISQT